MENKTNHKYISLREAAKYSGYSQEYLNLRIRQKKLRGIKIGRNWVIKKEWINEYVERVNNYKNGRAKKKRQKELAEIKEAKKTEKEIIKPRLTFTSPSFRLETRAQFIAILLALIFVFGSMGLVFGYPYFGPVLKEVTSNIREGIAGIGDNFPRDLADLGEDLQLGIAFLEKESNQIFKDLTKYLDQDARAIKKGFQILAQKIKQIPQKIAGVFKKREEEPTPEEIQTLEELVKELKEQVATKEQSEKIQKTLEELKEKGLPIKEIIKEVRQITQIQPVMEITKKVIDDKSLTELKSQITEIQGWEKDIETLQILTQKLQTHPPYTQVTTAPVYIGSQGLQVGGAASFSSLVVSGSVGIKDLGVGDSTMLGSNVSDKLTVNATADFISPVTIQNTLTGSTTTLATLTTTGDVTVGGNLTVSGAQTYSGAASFTASSTSPAFSVTQNGSGDLVRFNLKGTEKFKIDSSGNITLTGDTTIIGSVTTTGSIYATTYYSTSTDSTVRKSGEEVLRGTASIFRYEMPAQTSTTTYFRISKCLSQNPLSSSPSVLPGASRVYRLVIKYADDIATTSSSTWRIYRPSAATTSDAFTLPGVASSNLEEGEPYITEILTIPDTDWQVEVKVPATKTIRVFQIFLAAYDQID